MDKTVAQIRLSAAHKLGMGRGEGIELVEIRSNGDKMIFHSDETSVPTMMTLNGRLVVVFRDQIDTLVSSARKLFLLVQSVFTCESIFAGAVARSRRSG